MKTTVKIKNVDAMAKFIDNQIFPSIQRRISRRVVEEMKRVASHIVWESFKRHDIIIALSSPHPANTDFDIKAHLGLSDEDGKRAVDEMEEIVKESIIVSKARDTAIGVDISVSQLESNLRTNPAFQYWSTSDNGSYHIEWLKWILDGDGNADASIVFLDASDFSRSGRAIMKDIDNPLWHIADYDFFGGRNFINEAFEDPQLKKDLLTKLRQSLKDNINNI